MSRLRKFLLSVVSSYGVMTTHAVYVLISVPLCLIYLPKEAFAVWAIVLQITGYLMLTDVGISFSLYRLIIDHKDDMTSESYLSLVKSGWIAMAIAGLLIGGMGFFLIPLLSDSLNVPPEYKADFIFLIRGQSVLVALIFATRVSDQLLVANQLQYYTHLSRAVHILTWLCATAYLLGNGMGLRSLFYGNLTGWVIGTAMSFHQSARRAFFSGVLTKGRFSMGLAKQTLLLAGDTLLVALGSQLIMASQTLVISHQIGIATAATWAIITQTFMFAGQVVWRVFDASMPALSEMIKRNETSRLQSRFKDLTVFVTLLSVLVACSFATCNTAFISLWTGNKVSWHPVNDILLAIWLVMISVAKCHVSLIMATKCIRHFRFIHIIEGGIFICLALITSKIYGVTAIITSSIIATCLCQLHASARRTAVFLRKQTLQILFSWNRAAIIVAIIGSITGWVAFHFTTSWQPALQLAARGVVMLIFSTISIAALKPHLTAIHPVSNE